MSVLHFLARRSKIFISAIFVSFTFLLSCVSFSMSCVPSPTKEYLDYLGLIRIILYPTLVILMLLINFLAIKIFFKFTKIIYDKKKLNILVLLVTFSSFLLYFLWYFIFLPPNRFIGILNVDLSNAGIKNFTGSLYFLVFGLLYPNVISASLSFVFSRYLFTKYTEKNNRNTQKSIFLTVLMLPFVGTFVTVLILYFLKEIIPFTGDIWGSCVY